MCRNIKPLFNFDPPATNEEIQNATIQFVRKVSGMQKPNDVNQIAFNKAIESISKNIQELLISLQTNSKPKSREEEAEKARLRNLKRFRTSPVPFGTEEI